MVVIKRVDCIIKVVFEYILKMRLDIRSKLFNIHVCSLRYIIDF